MIHTNGGWKHPHEWGMCKYYSAVEAEHIIRLIIKKLKQTFGFTEILVFFVFFCIYFLSMCVPNIHYTSAPPDISVEKTWIHAAEGCDIQLACTLHGDVNSEVSWKISFWD